MNASLPFAVSLLFFAGALAHGAESCFPPPERNGGWRALVPVTRASLLVNGSMVGSAWRSQAARDTWLSHTIPDVLVRRGDRLSVTLESEDGTARLDYVELKRR